MGNQISDVTFQKYFVTIFLIKTLWCPTPTPTRLLPFIAYPVRKNALQFLFIVRHDVRDFGLASASLAAVLGSNPGEGYSSDNAVVQGRHVEY